MPWSPMVGATAAVAALILAQRPWEDHHLSLGLARVTIAILAAGAAMAVDDAAAVTLACSPTSLPWRRGLRLTLATAGAAGVAAAGLGAVAAMGGDGAVPIDRLVLEAAGMLLLALALSVALDGDRGAFVFAGVLLAAVVVQQRWPEYSLFPMAEGAPGWSGAAVAWAGVAVAGAGTLAMLSRDP